MYIEAKNLVKTFKYRDVVNRVSLRVEKGEIVGLLGPNGAGKTTTFYMIVGLEKPTAGEVYLSDVRIGSLPMYKRAQLGISYLAQEASVFRKLTVEENILSILETLPMTKAERQSKMEELLEEKQKRCWRNSISPISERGREQSFRAAREGASRSRDAWLLSLSSYCSMNHLPE